MVKRGNKMKYADMDLTDFASSYVPPDKRCELCRHYGFIDSGFGYCRRYPPVLVRVKLLKLRYEAEYPEVAWCENACGEFSKKEVQK